MNPPKFLLAAAAALALPLTAAAQKVTFDEHILPLFKNQCLKCHNPDKLKGDLDLTSFTSALKGGGSGVDLNAGDPDGSPLYQSITHAAEPTMPPNAKLTDRDIGVMRGKKRRSLIRFEALRCEHGNPKAQRCLVNGRWL
mgnify:CR=1 FL=1